jgi:ATP-dependent Clp protease ATP-binding subunit ClpA
MTNPNKITYYDLKTEIRAGRTPALVGREEEVLRLGRVINSNFNNNCLVVGPAGIGKTVFVYGWFSQYISSPQYKKTNFIQIEVENFYALISTPNLYHRFEEALEGVTDSIIFIDNFGSLIQNKAIFSNVKRLLQPIMENPKVKLILNLKPHELKSIEEEYPAWSSVFENIHLKNQEQLELVDVLKYWLSKFNKNNKITVKNQELKAIVNLSERFASLGQLPQSAIKILDESLSAATSLGLQVLTSDQILKVVSDKTGVPLAQLSTNDLENLKQLEPELNRAIIGQTQAVKKISLAVQRAKLGLKNPNRPLASFLMLGPSGVGKTETAKVLAAKVFGKKENFVRIDMSEFAQEHTVQRLVGAPPGYVGYDDGGALVNAVKQQPYSLILLDEIEKAHPRVFDIFLQILDDGRLTSGQGETIDFSQTIIMATSNLAVGKILDGFEKSDISSDKFIQESIIPELTKAFRLEFLNRFDSMVVFKPLTDSDLVKIAILEISKIEQRLTNHRVKFKFDDQALYPKIAQLRDNRFGARPIKRYIEELCENIITKALLK